MPSECTVEANDARSKSRSRACNKGKKKALSNVPQQLAAAPKYVFAKAIHEDAPQERRDVSRVLQVQAHARQRRGCIHSPVGIPIPSLSNPTSAGPKQAPALSTSGPLSERLEHLTYLIRARRTYGTPDNIRKFAERLRTNWSRREYIFFDQFGWGWRNV